MRKEVEMCGDGWKTENGLFSIYTPVITVNLASNPRTMNIPLVARYHNPLSHYCSFGAVFALISFTFLATGPEIITASVTWAMHYLSQPESGHVQSHLPTEIHNTFPSRLPTATIQDQISSTEYLSYHVGCASPVPSNRREGMLGSQGYKPKGGIRALLVRNKLKPEAMRRRPEGV